MEGGNKSNNGKKSAEGKKPENARTFKTTPTPKGEVPTSILRVPIPPAPGAAVWATLYNIFSSYGGKAGGGYSHIIENFHSIDELVAGLDQFGLRNKVAHLALVGHNEAAFANQKEEGTVTLDPPLPGTPSVPDSRGRLGRDHPPARPTALKTLEKLEPFLLPDGMLSFFMCWSGGGKRGSELLTTVSDLLPGRTIVGFCVSVEVGGGGDNQPGNACGVDLGECAPTMKRLTPWCIAAKRAWRGKIIRIPVLGRTGPPFHCANPHCGGHKEAGHDCPDGWWLFE
jgi:hypothetical protein